MKTPCFVLLTSISPDEPEGSVTPSGGTDTWMPLEKRGYFKKGDPFPAQYFPHEPQGYYGAQPYNMQTVRTLILQLKHGDSVSTRNKLRFCFQRLTPSFEKVFLHKDPKYYTADELLAKDNETLLATLFQDPTLCLSVKFPSQGSSLIIVDIDAKEKDPFTARSPVEQIILKGLPALLALEPSPFRTKPLVVQTPRGLHLLFRVPPTYKSKDRALTVTNLGFEVEPIASGQCVLIGGFYRLITSPASGNLLPDLPQAFFPARKGKKYPVPIIEGLIPVGRRWNFMAALVQAGAACYTPNGETVMWVQQFCLEKDADGQALSPSEIEFLVSKAKTCYTAAHRDVQFPTGDVYDADTGLPVRIENQQGVRPEDGVIVLPAASTIRGKLLSMSAGLKTMPDAREIRQSLVILLNRNAIKQLCQQFKLGPVLYMYMQCYGLIVGSAIAISIMTTGLRRYMIFVGEGDRGNFWFYDQTTGIWQIQSEVSVKKQIDSILDLVGDPQLKGEETLNKILREYRAKITVPEWGRLLSGFAYRNGVSVLGLNRLLEYDPELQMIASVDADFDREAPFNPVSEAYFKNFCGTNPASIHLLRGELFSTLFSVGSGSHFLYIKGSPSSGKSLFIRLLEYFYGPDSVYRADPNVIGQTFPFSGVSGSTRYIAFEDADKSTNTAKLLSFLKDKSTTSTFNVKMKFENAERTLVNVHFAMAVNYFLPPMDMVVALERRQIILTPSAVPVQEQNPNLEAELRRNINALQQWVGGTPHLLRNLRKFSPLINYMNSDPDFSFNPVAAFLLSKLDLFYFTPGSGTPYTSLPADAASGLKEPIVGVHNLYLESILDEKPLGVRDFADAVAELSRTVLFLPFDGSYNKSRRFGRSAERVCWENVTLALEPEKRQALEAQGKKPLRIKIPLEAAVLALLPPGVRGPETISEASVDEYSPGLKITSWYPEEWLKALFEVVKRGPEKDILSCVRFHLYQVEQILSYLAKREDEVLQLVDAWNDETDSSTPIISPAEATIGDVLKAVEAQENDPDELLKVDISSIVSDANAPSRGPALDLPEKVNPRQFTLKGKEDRPLDELATKLSLDSSAEDLYKSFLVARKQEAANRPPDVVEDTAPISAERFVSKHAFQQLAERWVKDPSLNEPLGGYVLDTSSTWEFVLSANKRLPSRGVSLVWDEKHTIIEDVLFENPAGLSPEGAESEQVQVLTHPPDTPLAVSEVENNDILDTVFDDLGDANKETLERTEVSDGPPVVPVAPVAPGVPVAPVPPGVPVAPVRRGRPPKDPAKRAEASKEKLEAKLSRAAAVKDQISSLAMFAPNGTGRNFISIARAVGTLISEFETPGVEPNLSFATGLKSLASSVSVEEQDIIKAIDADVQTTLEVYESYMKYYDWVSLETQLLSKFVFEPFADLTGDLSPTQLFISDPGVIREAADYDWGIQHLEPRNWRMPFVKASDNERFRERFAQWPQVSPAPSVLNKALTPALRRCFYVLAAVNNIKDAGFGRVSFSKKTGTRRLTTYWRSFDNASLFAEKYIGSPDTKDPGRLAVVGSSFTTLPRYFRDGIFPLLLNRVKGTTFFILDLKGAHAFFQAGLIKDKTPILYQVCVERKDLWQVFVDKSNGTMSMNDKRLLKVLFYAGLNGGNVLTETGCLRQLSRTVFPDEFRKRMPDLVRAFLAHPIARELKEVSQFWRDCAGELYVPTRTAKIERKLTLKEASVINTERMAEAVASRKDAREAKLVKEGDPMPHQLPTLYYTSLEFVFMTKLVGTLYRFFEERGLPLGIVQGVHDGYIFVTESNACLEEALKTVNERLRDFGDETIGIPLSASLQQLDKPGWLISSFEEDEEL